MLFSRRSPQSCQPILTVHFLNNYADTIARVRAASGRPRQRSGQVRQAGEAHYKSRRLFRSDETPSKRSHSTNWGDGTRRRSAVPDRADRESQSTALWYNDDLVEVGTKSTPFGRR